MNRNDTCPCGTGKKYKNCHLYIRQGFAKTKEGWISPREVARRRYADEIAKTIKV